MRVAKPAAALPHPSPSPPSIKFENPALAYSFQRRAVRETGDGRATLFASPFFQRISEEEKSSYAFAP